MTAGNLLDRLGVGCDFLVAGCGVRMERVAGVFSGDGREESDAGFGMAAADFAEVGLEVALELLDAIESGEGFVHTEAENDVVGWPFGE